jgi:hypothetical protein
MHETRDISHSQRETQELLFSVCVERGLSLRAISAKSAIPYSTVRTYAGLNGATAILPIDALYKLVGVVPNELLSLLLPTGFGIFTMPESVDHDEIEAAARDYLATKSAAHRADSPSGRDISTCEESALTRKAAVLKMVA